MLSSDREVLQTLNESPYNTGPLEKPVQRQESRSFISSLQQPTKKTRETREQRPEKENPRHAFNFNVLDSK